MKRYPAQPPVLRVLSWDVVGYTVRLAVRMVDVRPGRTDIPIGPPLKVDVPLAVWLDDDVMDMANTVWSDHLKDMLEADRRLALEGQERLPGM